MALMNKLREGLQSVQVIVALSTVLVGVVVSLTRTTMKVDAGEFRITKIETKVESFEKQNTTDHSAIRETLIQIQMRLGFICDNIAGISNKIANLERKP